jgi:HTH-type transcriptional regulator, competence development regulator
MEAKSTRHFGKVLREKRVAKGFSLRKFAEQVAVSPTYLSQVEHGNVDPPTVERVRRMAELLGENPDEMIALAGRISDDLPKIIHEQATEMPQLLRAASGLTSEQLRRLIETTRKIKSGG